jgi:hypothetical protein
MSIRSYSFSHFLQFDIFYTVTLEQIGQVGQVREVRQVRLVSQFSRYKTIH